MTAADATWTGAVAGGRCAIGIMAKAPRPGHSKTRLCPPLTPAEAAALSGAFLRDMAGSVLAAARSAPIDLFVAYAPAGTEPALLGLLPEAARLLLATGEGVEAAGVLGFGRPLLQALTAMLDQGYEAACLLNSDSPTLASSVLERAARLLLDGAPCVLGEASDGGYYLLGARAAEAALFAGIEWSTARVAAQTRAAARGAGIAVTELPVWYDVDDAAGLRRLHDDLDRNGAVLAPATDAVCRERDLWTRLALPA